MSNKPSLTLWTKQIPANNAQLHHYLQRQLSLGKSNQTAKRGNITIRIPAAQFESVMTQIKGMAISVISESTSGQDVTEEFVGLGARLGNLEATAVRVRGFLDEAETVEEALAVNQELSRLEGQIEVIKGRMQYLSQSAAFSTIYVNFTPDIVSQGRIYDFGGPKVIDAPGFHY